MKTSIRRLSALVLTVMLLCAACAAEAMELSSVEAVRLHISQTAPETLDLSKLPLSFEDIAALVDEYPAIRFTYHVDIFGVPVRSDQAHASLDGASLTEDYSIDGLCQRLRYLPELKQLDMFTYKLSHDEMNLLHDCRPDMRFGWTMHVGMWDVRTDAVVFSTRNSPESRRYKSKNFDPLRYCYQIKALDLGHNNIQDVSFIGELTGLRVLILADNSIKDITPLANLRELEYAELFMNKISDLSPLMDNPNLLDLNISWNKAKDYTPLMTCVNLERVWYAKNGLDEQAREALMSAFPNAHFEFFSSSSTGYGWRVHERYDVIKEMFAKFEYSPFPGHGYADDNR